MIWAPSLDRWMVLLLGLLVCFGLCLLYSAGEADSGLVLRQSVRLMVGLAIMVAIAGVPPYKLRQASPWLFVGSLLLLVAVLFVGEGRGAQRWLDTGIVRFQPSELAKLSVPMALAAMFHGRELPPSLGLSLLAAVLALLPVGLIFLQPDLGTALLIGASGVFCIFLAGLRWRWIVTALVALAALSPLVWSLMLPYQRNRILTLVRPDADPLGAGWNSMQAKIAVGSGGLTGKGWLSNTQSHLDFLPEHTTDFILAVYAEEFGFFGVAFLLTLYLAILGRGLMMAAAAKDTFSRLLGGSLILTFTLYVLVNCGMVSGLLPVVGVPLPLVSYGGTSLVTLLAGFGMLMSVYGHRKFVSS